jgi:hypothetical protein
MNNNNYDPTNFDSTGGTTYTRNQETIIDLKNDLHSISKNCKNQV